MTVIAQTGLIIRGYLNIICPCLLRSIQVAKACSPSKSATTCTTSTLSSLSIAHRDIYSSATTRQTLSVARTSVLARIAPSHRIARRRLCTLSSREAVSPTVVSGRLRPNLWDREETAALSPALLSGLDNNANVALAGAFTTRVAGQGPAWVALVHCGWG